MMTNESKQAKAPYRLLNVFDFLIAPTCISALTLLVLWVCTSNLECFKYFTENYRSSLRGSFFTGFLTLGSLMWAVKSFIVINLKKDYFEKQIEDNCFIKDMQTLYDANDKQYDFSVYFYPLVNLSRALFISTVSALSTAVIQITIGSLKNTWATIIACTAISFTLTLLAHTLYFVNANYKSWMNESTDAYNAKIKSLLK